MSFIKVTPKNSKMSEHYIFSSNINDLIKKILPITYYFADVPQKLMLKILNITAKIRYWHLHWKSVKICIYL